MAVALPSAIRAQVGATTDIVTGTITAENGRPVEGATVEVMSIESQVTRRGRTNAQGKYTVLFPDGGGQYRVTVRMLGLAPSVVNIARQADEDRLVADARMSTNPTQIQGVTVRAGQAPPPRFGAPTPGSTERAINTDQAARLPLDASDLNTLALLAPGVVSITGTDSTANAFSVAGQRPTANNITLDGLSFGSSSVPQEAVRSTRVITSSYDVARGQFSGGQIASTTRSGTNVAQGNFTYSLRDEALTIDNGDPSPLAQGFTQNQFSGGLGVPILRDRFFAFGSIQARRRDDALASLTSADANTFTRYGVSPDSVQRFLGISSANGISPFLRSFDNRTNDNYSALLRLDWLMPNGHSLTLRGDYRWSGQDPTRIGPLSLPQTGGSSENWGGGVMAVYTSNFGGKFLNELKVYSSLDKREATGFSTLPFGRVQVVSALDGGAQGISSLTFGGNPGFPQNGTTNTVEATNELSWLSSGGAHRVKLGGLVNRAAFEQDVTNNRDGTFSFNSLADLEAGRPSIFTRTLTPRIRQGSSLNSALYLGDTWRASRAVQLTFGARLEGSTFGGAPANNPDVESAFGYRTDNFPSEVHVSPRVGFTWTLGAQPQRAPALIVRGGIGEFRSTIPSSLVSGATSATGLAQDESQLVCIGAAVPTPDWGAFQSNPASIPTSCVGGASNPVPQTSRPNVTLFDNGFGAPRSWRGSLGAQRRFFDRYSLNLDLSFAQGVNQYGFRDLNLAGTPRFTLGSEGGRPVYVPFEAIVPATGATSLLGSRQLAQFGQVIAVNSDLESRTRQLTVSANGITRRGAILSLSYTLARSSDQSSFGGQGASQGFGAPTTAGDPNVREWATSDFDRRHNIVATVTHPFGPAIELTAFGRISSGAPFTPMVGSDINGDGSRNDRAFLFNPLSAPDSAIGGGMQRLLANAPESVRECLNAQLGGISARNSCRGPWQPSLDLQLNWRPSALGLQRRLAISFLTSNLLGGLDQLFNGSKNMKGWGSFRQTDNTLLYVRGFDQATQRYVYQVNERFGATRQGANGITLPFQLGFQARYTLGPDRQREMIQGMMRGGAGAFGGGRAGAAGAAGVAGPGGFLGAIDRIAPNPATSVIALKDSLGLTDEQVQKLAPIGDSLNAKNKTLGDALRKKIADAGANPDPAQLFGSIRPQLDELRGNTAKTLKEVEAVLTPEQWTKVPPRIKNAGQQGAGVRQGQGPRQQRPPGE